MFSTCLISVSPGLCYSYLICFASGEIGFVGHWDNKEALFFLFIVNYDVSFVFCNYLICEDYLVKKNCDLFELADWGVKVSTKVYSVGVNSEQSVNM